MPQWIEGGPPPGRGRQAAAIQWCLCRHDLNGLCDHTRAMPRPVRQVTGDRRHGPVQGVTAERAAASLAAPARSCVTTPGPPCPPTACRWTRPCSSAAGSPPPAAASAARSSWSLPASAASLTAPARSCVTTPGPPCPPTACRWTRPCSSPTGSPPPPANSRQRHKRSTPPAVCPAPGASPPSSPGRVHGPRPPCAPNWALTPVTCARPSSSCTSAAASTGSVTTSCYPLPRTADRPRTCRMTRWRTSRPQRRSATCAEGWSASSSSPAPVSPPASGRTSPARRPAQKPGCSRDRPT